MRRFKLDSDIKSLFTDDPQDQNIHRIGSGNSRVVYRINSSVYGDDVEGDVVKVSMDGVENEREYTIWNSLEDHAIKENLVRAKHKADDSTWLIMPFYEPLESREVDDSVYTKMSKLGSDISRDDFVEEKSTGNQMCCDYATISLDKIRDNNY